MNINQLFDIVAPIVICASTDYLFEEKAKKSFEIISKMDPSIWTKNGCPKPTDCSWENFNGFCYKFAHDAYNHLFDQIVETNGPSELIRDHDYWGAKGYRLPHQNNKNFEISGDMSGYYPMYETAELLIKRLSEIDVTRYREEFSDV